MYTCCVCQLVLLKKIDDDDDDDEIEQRFKGWTFGADDNQQRTESLVIDELIQYIIKILRTIDKIRTCLSLALGE